MNIDAVSNSPVGFSPQPASTPTQARPPVKPAAETQNPTSAPPPRSEPKEQTKQEVNNAVEKLSSFVSALRPELSFTVDQGSGARVVQLIDTQSQQVIRQIPSEEAVQLAQALDKLQGLFVREKA